MPVTPATQPWHCLQQGDGPPLVLLHGIGMSAQAWQPLLPLLAAERRVLAFDVAGFGRTPRLPAGIHPTATHLAHALHASLRAMGFQTPVDMAGNSMGGLLALEAARLGYARSVAAISPAGLSQGRLPPHIGPTFVAMRWSLRHLPALGERLLRNPVSRSALLAVPMSISSWRMPAEAAVQAAREFATADAFEDTFKHLGYLDGGQRITVPVSVAFGRRDWLLTPSMRRRDQLPPGARWIEPAHWGHVPMWDDPVGVARFILDSTT